MELRHLRYFLGVAETLNFSRAAEKLHVAQPSLSKQIRDLEHQVGAALFVRDRQRVELTAAGRVFREQARLVLEQAARAVQLAQRADRGEIGRLAVGFVGSVSYSFLPWVLRAFRERFPGVELDLRELDLPDQIASLRDGRIDAGFLRLPVQDENVAFEVIFREPFVLALPADHPLAGRQAVPLEQLADEAFILFPDRGGSGFRRQIVELCQRGGFLPHVVQEAAPMQNVIGLVGAGIGIAIVPESVQKIRVPEVEYRPFDRPLPQAEIALAWRKGDRNPVVGAFFEVARAVASQRSTPDVAHGSPPG